MIAPPEVQPFEAIPEVEIPDAARRNPVAYLIRAALEHGPIFRRRTPRRQVARYGAWQVYLVGPEANRFVLHTQRAAFSHEHGWRAFFGGVWDENLLYLDHEVHAAHRRVMQPAFTQAAITRYLPVLHAIIVEQTRAWPEQEVVEVRGALRRIAFQAVAQGLFGFAPGPEVARLHDLRDALCRNPYPYGKERYWQHINAGRQDLNAQLRALLAMRPMPRPDDVIGLLMAARTPAPDTNGDQLRPAISDEQFLGHLQVLLEAGHTTTMDTATWVLGLLATHPAEQEHVRAEIDAVLDTQGEAIAPATLRAMPTLARAIDEAGRLRTPVDTAPRGVLRDLVFAGYQLPEGTFVRLHLGACHRLPTVFRDPDRFDPDRFASPRGEDKATPYGLVTFGGGPRICIGITFAQTEIRALVAHLLRHYVLEAIPGATPANVYDPGDYDDSLPRGLPLRIIPRSYKQDIQVKDNIDPLRSLPNR